MRLVNIMEDYSYLSESSIQTQGQLDLLKNTIKQIEEDGDVVAFEVPCDMYYALFDIAQDYVSGRLQRRR